MRYTKPPLPLKRLLRQLIDRGLGVSDRQAALHALERISYYRLSGYWLPFKQPDDNFEPGADFDVVLMLYEFDRRLRLLVLDAIERVEIAVRTAITHEFSLRYGPYGHTDPANFRPRFDPNRRKTHGVWLRDIEKEAQRSKELFVRHHQNNYHGFPTLPTWKATEVISLGALSYFFGGMKPPDQATIAEVYGVHPKVLSSWLHTLTYVRNVCAHHSRLWDKSLSIPPKTPKSDGRWLHPLVPRRNGLWIVLLILRQMMHHHRRGHDWQADIEQLVTPIAVQERWRKAMGFPVAWQSYPIWNPA